MNRLRGLDALRGIAALLVLVHHLLFVMARDLNWAAAITSAVDLGALGVAIFFLISGFVIPLSLRSGLGAFGISRAARLLPALWLSMLFAIAMGAKVTGFGQILANAFMVGNLFGRELFIGPYWTLGWELAFYGITAALFALGHLNTPRAFGLLSLAAGVVSLGNGSRAYLIFMFCGALLRMALMENNEAAKMWLRVSCVMLLAVFYLWAHGQHTPAYFYSMLLAFPTFLLLWNRLSHPALLWLGGVSYSLYLFHMPIVRALEGADLPLPLFVLLSLAIPLLVARVVFRWVEQPMIALGKSLSHRLSESHQLRPA